MYNYPPEPIDILILANWDWANTGWRYKKAMESMPAPRRLRVLMYKGQPHSFNYPEQAPIHYRLANRSYKMDDDGTLCRHPVIIPCPELKALVERAQCVWFQAETFIETGADLSGKHVFVTLAGATMREEPEKVSEFFNAITEKTIAQFPTLMNLGCKDEVLVYYPVDTDYLQPEYYRHCPDKIIIGHFPSNPENKGSEMIRRVVDKIRMDPKYKDKMEYIGVAATKRSQIHSVDWRDNIDRMKKCDVIIETIQMEIGGKPFGEWGNTALEASALGKICITNSLNTELYKREYGDLGLWIANDADQLEAQIKKALDLDNAELCLEKQKIRRWAETYHSIPATGKRLWYRVFKEVFVDG